MLFSRLVIRIFQLNKCTDWSRGRIQQLSDATHACSRSTTNIWDYINSGHNCTQHSTNRRDDYCVTHGGIAYHVEQNAEGTPSHQGFSVLISVEFACEV